MFVRSPNAPCTIMHVTALRTRLHERNIFVRSHPCAERAKTPKISKILPDITRLPTPHTTSRTRRSLILQHTFFQRADLCVAKPTEITTPAMAAVAREYNTRWRYSQRLRAHLRSGSICVQGTTPSRPFHSNAIITLLPRYFP